MSCTGNNEKSEIKTPALALRTVLLVPKFPVLNFSLSLFRYPGVPLFNAPHFPIMYISKQ